MEKPVSTLGGKGIRYILRATLRIRDIELEQSSLYTTAVFRRQWCFFLFEVEYRKGFPNFLYKSKYMYKLIYNFPEVINHLTATNGKVKHKVYYFKKVN